MNYSRTICLPGVWLDSVGLNIGDYVEVEMLEGGSLLLKPTKAVKP